MTLMKNAIRSIPGIAIALALLAGCASVEPPQAQLARSEAAVQQAAGTGAQQHAPLDLRRALQKLEQARLAMEEEDYLEARRLAEQAEVDAELAQVKAQTAEAQQTAEDLEENIRILRDEISRRDG